MGVIQRRMFCRWCKREWVEPSTGLWQNSAPLTITGNKRNDLCPMCGGPDIEFMEFQAAFPGGDIPRPDSDPIPVNYQNQDFPPNRPPTVGFVQNNLIAMLREEKEKG